MRYVSRSSHALTSLHIYTGWPEPRHSTEIPCAGSNGDLMLFCASSKGSGESAHLHRLTLYSLRHCTKILHSASNGDLCAIHPSSVDSGESAHLRRHSHWTMRYVSKSHVLAAKALASLHICIGSPEPRHSNEVSCAGSNGDLCIVYVTSKRCGEFGPATTAQLCNQ